MSSDKKLSLQLFVEAFAENASIPKHKADHFMRTFFEVIEEGLARDGLAKVKGFGTFKLVAVSPRESVSVNTGDRIQITGYTKVTFTPDPALRDLVNLPFSNFTTTVLSEDLDLSLFDEIDDNPLQRIATTNQEETTLSHSTPILSKEEETDAPLSTPNEGRTSLPPLTKEAQTTEPTSLPSPSPLVPPPFNPLAFQTASKPLYKAVEEEIGDETPSIISFHEKTKVQEEDMSSSLPYHTMETAGRTTTIIEKETLPPPPPTTISEEETPFIDETTETTTRPFQWRYLLVGTFLLILLAIFIGYQWGSSHSSPSATTTPTTPTTTSPQKTQKESPLQDTTSIKAEETKKATQQHTDTLTTETPTSPPNATTTIPYEPTATYRIVGTLKTHRLQKGESLNTIAKQTYGSKEFYRYIIEHNQFDNPDLLTVDTPIKLPKLEQVK